MKVFENESDKIRNMVKSGMSSDVFEKYCQDYREKKEHHVKFDIIRADEESKSIEEESKVA